LWARRLFQVYERARPPRQLRTTSLGKIVIAFTIVIGVAATNTGNNLLYLVLGGLFGLISASGILSERVLRRLHVTMHLPHFVTAGSTAVVHVEITAAKNVDSVLVAVAVLDIDERPLGTAFVRQIAAGSRRRVPVPLVARTRGALRIGGVRIATRYPFQMYEKSRRFDIPGTLWVAPAPDAGVRLPEHGTTDPGDPRRAQTADGDEFRGLRQRLVSDPPSRVHWRRSAGTHDLFVKVFAAGARSELDLRLRAGTDALGFERDLERAAGLLDAARRRSWAIAVEAGAVHFRESDPDQGWRLAMLTLAQADRAVLPPGETAAVVRSGP
jgi:uncharacterized protein (DUF58 family)